MATTYTHTEQHHTCTMMRDELMDGLGGCCGCSCCGGEGCAGCSPAPKDWLTAYSTFCKNFLRNRTLGFVSEMAVVTGTLRFTGTVTKTLTAHGLATCSSIICAKGVSKLGISGRSSDTCITGSDVEKRQGRKLWTGIASHQAHRCSLSASVKGDRRHPAYPARVECQHLAVLHTPNKILDKHVFGARIQVHTRLLPRQCVGGTQVADVDAEECDAEQLSGAIGALYPR